MSRTLHDIIEKLPESRWISQQDTNPSIRTLAHDSRKVGSGTLFVCMPGATVDGHSFAVEAINKGAVALLAEHAVDGADSVPVLLVPDVRKALEKLAPWFY